MCIFETNDQKIKTMSKKEEKKGEKKVIDFTQCTVDRIDGASDKQDLSGIAKDIANIVFQNTNELSVYVACQDVFKTGKCDWSEKIEEDFRGVIESLLIENRPASILLKNALLSALG